MSLYRTLYIVSPKQLITLYLYTISIRHNRFHSIQFLPQLEIVGHKARFIVDANRLLCLAVELWTRSLVEYYYIVLLGRNFGQI